MELTDKERRIFEMDSIAVVASRTAYTPEDALGFINSIVEK